METAHPDWQSKYCDPPGYELGQVPGSSPSIAQTSVGLREAAATPTAGLTSSSQAMGEEANLDTRHAGNEKLGGTVHNKKKNWFSEMEESFMVNIEFEKNKTSGNNTVHFLHLLIERLSRDEFQLALMFTGQCGWEV